MSSRRPNAAVAADHRGHVSHEDRRRATAATIGARYGARSEPQRDERKIAKYLSNGNLRFIACGPLKPTDPPFPPIGARNGTWTSRLVIVVGGDDEAYVDSKSSSLTQEQIKEIHRILTSSSFGYERTTSVSRPSWYEGRHASFGSYDDFHSHVEELERLILTNPEERNMIIHHHMNIPKLWANAYASWRYWLRFGGKLLPKKYTRECLVDVR